MKTICFFLIFFTPILQSGCGYHLKTAGQPVGIEIESLAIPVMTSTSSESGFEGDFTRVVREEFIHHAKFPVISSDKAHMVLKGHIYDISTDAVSYDLTLHNVSGTTVTHETTAGRRLKIKLEITLTDQDSGKIVWYEKAMVEQAKYDVTADPMKNRYNQQQALQDISESLSRRIYQQIMERF